MTRITGDAQSAPCSPLADVRNWYWKRVERSNHPNCTKCSVRKSPCASKQSDACMVHTDRSVGRRICSDPQSATMLVQPCSQSPCAVLNGDITRPRRVDNHEDGTNHTRYTPGCPVVSFDLRHLPFTNNRDEFVSHKLRTYSLSYTRSYFFIFSIIR